MRDEDFRECRHTAMNRWPDSVSASSEATWSEWRKSLDHFAFADVMTAVILLGETDDRFPPLARLIVGIQVAQDERERKERPLLDPPKATTTVAIRLEQFDRAMVDDRTRRHAELAVFVRLHGEAALNGTTAALRHAQIDEVGPWEAKAREWVARGIDPTEGARAFVAQFVANASGDPDEGIHAKPEREADDRHLSPELSTVGAQQNTRGERP